MSSEMKAGFKRTSAGIVPNDWSTATIEDIGFTSSGTTPSRSQFERYFRGGKINWVKTLDLNNSWIYATEEQVTATAIEETSLRVYSPGAVLVAMYGGFNQIGRTGLLKVPACVNQAITAIQCREALRPEYLLATLNFRSEYWKSVASSSRKDPNITSTDIRDFPIAYPDQHEQASISAALSDMDTLISGLDQLIAKKRDIKQATMQQLLTGQTRLPGFSGEWEVKRLGDIAEIDPESLPGNTAKDYTFKYISLENVDAGRLIGFSEVVFSNAPSRARRKLRRNDVLISTVRPNLMSHLLFSEAGEGWVCSTGFSVVRCGDGVVHPEYIFACFFGGIVNRQIDKIISGSNYPSINSADVNAIEIPTPSFSEQTAIATILSEMDAELAGLEIRRDKAKQLKQGMMQELLTGRIRLI